MTDGGCGPVPKKSPGVGSGRGCFVATAAYGSELHPFVQELRGFRDEVLRSTTYGRQFWDEFYAIYERVSRPVVEAMGDSRVRELTRWAVVTPLVHYLRIARTFPDADPAAAGPTWQPFLEELRSMLSEFTGALPLPSELASLPPAEAAQDLAIALRFMLRDQQSREAWLAQLHERGELPLRTTAEELAEVVAVLRNAARPEREVSIVTGGRSTRTRMDDVEDGHADGELPPVLTGFGQVHVDTSAPADRSRWLYTVTIRNNTTDTYTNVRCFYLVKPGAADNMGMTIVGVINPGDVVVFPLGICSEVLSYSLEGDFTEAGGASGSFEWPNQGPMTPARASRENPTDSFPCEDSFQFTF
jgi:hypothetical protein